MAEILHANNTIIVQQPTWNGRGFNEVEAQSFWLELPAVLQSVALAEIKAGNNPVAILRNGDRAIVLLSFERGPLAEPPPSGIVVHSQHQYGNYCYDGTQCTYEDPVTGSFLAFHDLESSPCE